MEVLDLFAVLSGDGGGDEKDREDDENNVKHPEDSVQTGSPTSPGTIGDTPSKG